MHSDKTATSIAALRNSWLKLGIGVFAVAAYAAYALLTGPSIDKAMRLLETNQPKQAAAMLAALAADNNAQAASLLGGMLWRGEGLPRDSQKAIPYLKQAALDGDVQANALLGEYYSGPQADASCRIAAVPYLKTAADRGHAGSAGILGKLYYTGTDVVKSRAQAAEYLAVAARQGEPEAMLLYGGMLLRGDGVAKNHRQGSGYLEAAAEQGDPALDFAIGEIYREANLPEKALPHYLRAHDGGESAAGYPIAAIHQRRLAPDYEAIVHYAKPLAEAGHEESCAILANVFYSGKGGITDRTAAYRYMQPAVTRGNARAMARTGFMLATGDGVPRDVVRGVQLLTEAGNLGHAGAFLGLGALYYSDQYDMYNYEQALVYLRRAADLGDSRATDLLASGGERQTIGRRFARQGGGREDVEELKETIGQLERQLETLKQSIAHQQQEQKYVQAKAASMEKAKQNADREVARQNKSLAKARAEAQDKERYDRTYGSSFDQAARARQATERNTRNETRLDKLTDSAARNGNAYWHGGQYSYY